MELWALCMRGAEEGPAATRLRYFHETLNLRKKRRADTGDSNEGAGGKCMIVL